MKFLKVLFLVVISTSVLKAQLTVIPKVTHLSSPSTPNAGAISLTVSGGTLPYSYSWTPGSYTTSAISSLSYGTYAAKVTDSGTAIATTTCSIGYKVNWAEFFGTVQKQDTIQNDGSTGIGWGSASSKNTLAGGQDGWFEVVLKDLNQYKKIGFSDSISTLKTSASDIDYGFYYVVSPSRLYKIVNGAETLISSNPSEGTVLRVERVGNVISIKVNGAVIYTTTSAADAAKVWKVKTSLNASNKGSFVNVGCSFYNQGNVLFPGFGGLQPRVQHVFNAGFNEGSIKVAPSLNGSYTYSWQPGSATSSSITTLPLGSYSLTMTDSLSNKRKAVYNIGYKIKWGNFYGTAEKHDSLVNIGPYGWAHAISKNYIPGSTDGWFEYVLRDVDKSKTIGFLDSVYSSGSLVDIDYGFYYYADQKQLAKIEKGIVSSIENPLEGSVLRVERIGSTINLKINGKVVYTTVNATDASKRWYVKAQVFPGAILTAPGMSTSSCSLTASAGASQTITCASPTITLTGSSNTSGVTYSWTPGGSSPTSSVTVVSSGGIYTLQVTDPSTGCIVISTTTVTQNFCAGATVTDYQSDSLRGSIHLNITGGTAPYNIAWNTIKLPSSTIAYHALLNMGYPAGADSIILKHQFDSIRQNTVLSGLMPGNYPVTIYDANNDSLKVVVVVGVDMDTVLAKGLTVAHPSSYKDTRNGLLHLYGSGIDLGVSGGIVPGENLAVFSSVVSPLKASLFEFSIPDTSSLAVGLTSIQGIIPYGTDDIKSKAAFIFEGNSYSIYVGNLLRYIGSYNPGDLFSISGNTTGALQFYKNDAEVYRAEFLSIATPDNEFLYKAVLNRSNAKLIKIKVIGPIGLAYGVTGTIKDVSCTNPCSGTIDVVGRGKLIGSPDRYELYAVSNPGTLLATVNTFPSGNHALFTNLCPGKYSVKFYYTYQELVLWGGTPVTSTGLLVGNFEVAYVPEWTNAVNVTISPDRSLTKTGGITDWDAGASTENFLKSVDNGWIEWTSPSVESINAIGFNDVDQSLDIADIDYANGYFKINTGFLGIWKYFIKTHNSLMINSLFINGNPMHPFVENQKFRLEKEVVAGVTSIKLFYNNGLADQFTGITATDYVVDASLKQLLGTINNPRVSFGCGPSSTQYAVPKREADGGYYALDGVNLRFTLDGEYTLSNMKFRVLDRTRTIVLSDAANGSLLNAVTTKPGDNRYILDCSSLAAGYYALEVSNEKNEKLYLRFKR